MKVSGELSDTTQQPLHVLSPGQHCLWWLSVHCWWWLLIQRAESYSPMATEQQSGWKWCLGTTDLLDTEAEDSLLVANPHNCLVLWSSFGVCCFFFLGVLGFFNPTLVRNSVAKCISKQENSTTPCYSKKWWCLSFFFFIAKLWPFFIKRALLAPSLLRANLL